MSSTEQKIKKYYKSESVPSIDISQEIMKGVSETSPKSYFQKNKRLILIIFFILVVTIPLAIGNLLSFLNSTDPFEWKNDDGEYPSNSIIDIPLMFRSTDNWGYYTIQDYMSLYDQLSNDYDLTENQGIAGHMKHEDFEDGINAIYVEPIITNTKEDMINITNEYYDIKSLLELIPERFNYENSFIWRDWDRDEVKELKKQLEVNAYTDEENVHIAFFDTEPSLYYHFIHFTDLNLITGPVTDNVSSFNDLINDKYLKIEVIEFSNTYVNHMIKETDTGMLEHTILLNHDSNGLYQKIVLYSTTLTKQELLNIAENIIENYTISKSTY